MNLPNAIYPSLSSSPYKALPIVVQKFGGTSVATVAQIRRIAERAIDTRSKGQNVVLVVSAMAGETDRLLALAEAMADVPDRAETDTLLASGEQTVAALTAIAIRSLGGKSRSLLGHQVRILTDSTFGSARIQAIDCAPITACFENGEIPVVAGFQGVDATGRITTLGRGWSDTTAVALAAALRAKSCEMFTDIDGVYTADPNVCADAHKLSRISYGHMLEMAALGAKVLHSRCVETAVLARNATC